MSHEHELKRYLDPAHCMTVGQLKELLADHDDDLPVVFGYTANDYWRTQIAESISDAEEGPVGWSAYHSKLQQVDEDTDSDEELSEAEDAAASGRTVNVLILRA